MAALIDAVYLYTKLDAIEQMEMTACDIASVVDAVRTILAQLIQERGAVITCGPLPVVRANRVHMIQLFQNLVTNAIRHCDMQVSIHISAEECEDHWQLTIRDNGPGIEPEHCKRIFDPFMRFSQSAGGGAGLGLGLAISQKVVQAYGGKLWCDSEFGTGTAFHITSLKPTVPMVDEGCTPNPTALLKTEAPSPSGLPIRILLVDDNRGDLKLNRIILVEDAKLDCDVLTASNGKDALVLLQDAAQRDTPVDLVLLDINMPIMNGFELLTRMNKQAGLDHTLVVMCTTSGSDMDQREAASLGAIGYLTKPPTFSQFKDIIASCGRLRLSQGADDWVLRRAA